MNTIQLRIEGAVARIVIDNPARRNAMSRAMWRAVPELTAEARANPAVRLLTLQSAAPGAFCAGADISEFESTHASPDESQRSVDEISHAVDALAQFDRPTLALIDGVCVGGGMALVLGCDMRIASTRSTFSITPAKLGLSYHPDDIARLVAICGPANASEFLFAAQMWSAERCVASGFLNRAVEAEAFDAACNGLVEAISQHSLDAQRYFNLLCIVYGRDPDHFGGIVQRGMLPKERADRCPEESAKITRSWARLLLPHFSPRFKPHDDAATDGGNGGAPRAPASSQTPNPLEWDRRSNPFGN